MFDHIENCPICSGQSQAFPTKIYTYLNMYQKDIESSYAYCERCDFAYVSNPLPREELKKYYEGNEKLRRDNIMPIEGRHISEQASLVQKHVNIEGGDLFKATY